MKHISNRDGNIFIRSSKHEKQLKDSSLVKKVLKKQLDDLGPMTFHQTILAILFAVLILLWFFRDPEFVPGWISLFPNKYLNLAYYNILINE